MNKILKIFGWLSKNIGLIIGIVEQIIKVLGGIVSLTPTRKDDIVVKKIDEIFARIKKPLYQFGEWTGNL